MIKPLRSRCRTAWPECDPSQLVGAEHPPGAAGSIDRQDQCTEQGQVHEKARIRKGVKDQGGGHQEHQQQGCTKSGVCTEHQQDRAENQGRDRTGQQETSQGFREDRGIDEGSVLHREQRHPW